MLVGVMSPVVPASAATGTISFDSATTAVDEDSGLVLIDISRTDTTDEVTVDYVVGGSNSGDFSIASGNSSGTITFAAGQASASLSVNIVDDLVGEGGTETFTITLQNPTNIDSPGDPYTIGQATNQLEITDDGDRGSIVFSSTTSSVNEADVDVVASVSVTRTGGSEGAVTARVRSTGGDAGPSDFDAVNTLLSWGDGDSSNQNVDVTVTGDNVVEAEETVVLEITNTTGGATGSGTHDLDIIDDDSAGTVELGSTEKTVNEGAGSVLFTLNRVGGSDGSLVAQYSTSDGSATAPDDYTATAGSVTFAQGETSKSISVPIVDDLDFAEADEETFTFTLTASGDNTVVKIVDNDEILRALTDRYTTREDTALDTSFSVLDNDTGPTGPGGFDLDVVSFSAPTPGGALSNVDLENGTFTYTPPANYSGTVFFSYEMTDGNSTAVGTVRIDITDENAAPEGVDDTYGLLSRIDQTVLSVLDNDIDQDGDELRVVTNTLTTGAGNEVDCSIGTGCVFTPVDGFVGEDTFDYTLADTSDVTSSATVVVFVGIPRGCDAIATPGVVLEGTPGDDVLCGSDGDDIIDGMGGDDFILAGPGNDILRGGDGKDLLMGGDGDDDITPGPGDNDDTVGGEGNDTVNYRGTDPGDDAEATGADTVFVTEWSISIDTANDQTSPAEDADDADEHESVETVVFDGLGGNDIVTVQAGENAAIDLRGGAGTADRLKYDTSGLEGVSDNGSVISATGRQPVNHSGFEIRETDVFLTKLTPASDTLQVRFSPPEGLIIDPAESGDTVNIYFGSLGGPLEVNDSGEIGDDAINVNGTDGVDEIEVRATSVRTKEETIAFRGIEDLTVFGNGGDDRFSIEVGAGFRPKTLSPALIIVGGDGSDTLVLSSDAECLISDSFLVHPVTGQTVESAIVSIPGVGDFDVTGVEVVEYDCANGSGTRPLLRGYWIVDADGNVTPFGVPDFGDRVNPQAEVTGLASRLDKQGYWTVEANGQVTPFGWAEDHGDLVDLGIDPAFPIVGISALPDGDGYYLLGEDGGIFAFNSPFYGSTGDIRLDLPVTAMDVAPGGNGYWFVAADGGVFAYGPGAAFFGSLPEYVSYDDLAADIVGMATTASGNGYWLVAADGGVFAFGDAPFLGSVPEVLGPGVGLAAPIVGMVATPSGNGYWLVAEDGGVFTFGDAPFVGALGGTGAAGITALAG